MASHHTTIAKAAFAAACLRPDAKQLTREEIANFHTFLEAAVSRCSSSNVQTCKKWLSDYIISSSHRIVALGKYLVSFSKNAAASNAQTRKDGSNVSTARKRLHVLYVLNDLLHHVKFHTNSSVHQSLLTEGLQTHIAELVVLARSELKKHVERRVEELVEMWEREQYFASGLFAQIKGEAPISQKESTPASLSSGFAQSARETSFIMPATHGDPTVPYYDLPAANLMPHIIPNKSIPMRPDQIRALQLSAGPADESLVNAVKDFLKDVEHMKTPYQSLEEEGIVPHVDDLGQLSYINEAGEVTGDTYYGWSREFCNKMKKRGQDENDGADRSLRFESSSRQGSRSRSRSRSLSRSRSSSRSPPKRRKGNRLGSPPSGNHQRYDSRSRSQSPTVRDSWFQQERSTFRLSHVDPTPTLSRPKPNLPPAAQTVGANVLPVPLQRPPNYTGPWPPPPPPPAFLPPYGFPTGNIPFVDPSQRPLGPNSQHTFYQPGHKDKI